MYDQDPYDEHDQRGHNGWGGQHNSWRSNADWDPYGHNFDRDYGHDYGYGYGGYGGGSWFDSLKGLWQWDELASEVSHESQARVAFMGLRNAGKSTLFNHLRGWEISWSEEQPPHTDELRLEPLGTFVLIDLPTVADSFMHSASELLMAAGDPILVVYLIDGTVGVQPADYRWIALLRATGKPLVIAYNKCDEIAEFEQATAEASQKLGIPVLPISARHGVHIEDKLLPAMLDATPRLAVPLAREVQMLRRTAARRVMRQAALFAGMMSAQPIPLLDLPLQAAVQVGLVMRIGAAYGHAPSGGVNREVIGTVVSSLALRYAIQSAIKLIPVLGSVVSGFLGATATYIIGEAAIRYYEAGQTIPLKSWIGQQKTRFRRPRWLRSRNDHSVEEDVSQLEAELIPVFDSHTHLPTEQTDDEEEGQP